MTKLAFATALLVGLSSFAFAADTTPSAGTTTLTEQAVPQNVTRKLEQAGYSNINLKPLVARSLSGSTTAPSSSSGDSPSVSAANAPRSWVGTAIKAGKQVNIEVDPTGNVTEK
jgi:hypothetical protein